MDFFIFFLHFSFLLIPRSPVRFSSVSSCPAHFHLSNKHYILLGLKRVLLQFSRAYQRCHDCTPSLVCLFCTLLISHPEPSALCASLSTDILRRFRKEGHGLTLFKNVNNVCANQISCGRGSKWLHSFICVWWKTVKSSGQVTHRCRTEAAMTVSKL